jgi:hypothetical protein
LAEVVCSARLRQPEGLIFDDTASSHLTFSMSGSGQLRSKYVSFARIRSGVDPAKQNLSVVELILLSSARS